MFSWAGRAVFLGGAILNCGCWSLTVNALWTNNQVEKNPKFRAAVSFEVYSKMLVALTDVHGLLRGSCHPSRPQKLAECEFSLSTPQTDRPIASRFPFLPSSL